MQQKSWVCLAGNRTGDTDLLNIEALRVTAIGLSLTVEVHACPAEIGLRHV